MTDTVKGNKDHSRLWWAMLVLGSASVVQQPLWAADSVTQALTEGRASLDVRLRYESVEQDNALKDADSATLRTRLGYATDSYQGFSGVVSFEDVRHVLGVEDYSLGFTGFKTGEFSTIADPEVTELDEGYLQYKEGDFTAKLGAQVIVLDNHRFVGHVGWRQDRQTFDALMLQHKVLDDITLSYYYIEQRRRIFAEAVDKDAKDHLFHLNVPAGPGKLSVYAYLLEEDIDTDNSLDTYGLRYAGKAADSSDIGFLYTVELASQASESAGVEYDADYLLLEGGILIQGYTLKAGYEVLSSDNGNYGFATPLATLHKFNGWADQFLGTPNTGLTDFYLSAGAKVAGGNAALIFHTFEADESTATIDDLGSEVNLVYAKKFAKRYSAGIKYAAYSAGDAGAGKVDTDRLWLWLGAKI